MDASVVALAAAAPAPSGPDYSSAAVARLAGITYRQLDYWDRRGIVTPSIPAAGPGSARTWSLRDLVTVAAVARLSELGGRADRMRRLAAFVGILDLALLPVVVAVDAAGRCRLARGSLDDFAGCWLVLVEIPGGA